MRRATFALLGILAVAALSGCGDCDDGPPGASAPALAVTVRDAGAEPRQPLRYALTAGTRRSYRLSQAMTMSMASLPKPMETRTKSTLDLEVVSVAADGSADVRSTASASTLEGLGDSGTPARVPGVRSRMRMTARGEMRDVELEYDTKDVDPETRKRLEGMASGMKESLQRAAVLLPEVPVGVGARWTLAGTASAMGLTFDTSADVVLLSRDGDVATFETTMTMRAGAQSFTPPGSPRTIEVTSAEASGTSKMTVDLRAAGSTGTASMKLKMAMKAGKVPAKDGVPPLEIPPIDLDATIEQTIERAD